MPFWKVCKRKKVGRLYKCAAAAAKSLQSCPTLCDPIDGSQRGSPVPGILQARTLEWVAISFSNAWKRKVKVKSLSRVRLFATPWTAAHQVPPSVGFSRQKYWSGVPLPSPPPASRNSKRQGADSPLGGSRRNILHFWVGTTVNTPKLNSQIGHPCTLIRFRVYMEAVQMLITSQTQSRGSCKLLKLVQGSCCCC